MKEVLSLCTFVIAALCFVVFLSVFKPDATSAVHAPGRLERCSNDASPAHGCSPQAHAAASSAIVWLWQ
jgi:hypothetical protein